MKIKRVESEESPGDEERWIGKATSHEEFHR